MNARQGLIGPAAPQQTHVGFPHHSEPNPLPKAVHPVTAPSQTIKLLGMKNGGLVARYVSNPMQPAEINLSRAIM